MKLQVTDYLYNLADKRMPISFLSVITLFASFTLTNNTFAANASGYRKQDVAVIKEKIESYLMTQTVGYPGVVSVNVTALDPNINLAACVSPEVFMPSGSRAWGKTTVGVRCSEPANWTIYAQAKVSVKAQYLVAALPLTQGRVMSEQDILKQEGDLTQLPTNVLTSMTEVIGRTVSMTMIAGSVLREDMLKQVPVVQQGQSVLLTSSGEGFTVAAEGKALKNANEGQVVQVKVQSGQVISGIARLGGKVEVSF